MNANYKKNNESVENYLEEVWQATQRSINLSKAVLILAMADYFGLGKKRMESFFEFYNDFAKKHIEYEHDGIHMEKINEALKKFDTDFETLFGYETYKEAVHSIKIQKRNQTVSYADAISAQNKLKGYANYVKSIEREDANNASLECNEEFGRKIRKKCKN